MPKFLFNVADCWVQSNSLIIFSDRPDHEIDHRFGDQLELRRPDGTVIQAKNQIVFVDRPATETRSLAVAFSNMKESDAPVGTEVWLIDSNRSDEKLHLKFRKVEK